MSDYFARNGDEITMEQWTQLFSDHDYKRVALDEVGPYQVSTVWLGLNHNWGEGPPLIFETMVFTASAWKDERPVSQGGEGLAEFDMDRYATEEQARVGHEAMCLLIRATLQESLPELDTERKKEGC